MDVESILNCWKAFRASNGARLLCFPHCIVGVLCCTASGLTCLYCSLRRSTRHTAPLYVRGTLQCRGYEVWGGRLLSTRATGAPTTEDALVENFRALLGYLTPRAIHIPQWAKIAKIVLRGRQTTVPIFEFTTVLF